MGFMKSHRTTIVLGAVALSLAAAPAAQGAAEKYHPDANARTFANNGGGWVGSSSYTNGLCIPAVTCPAVDHDYVATGGSRGADDGFVRTELGGLASLASGTAITYQSPGFTYKGVRNAEPDKVSFKLDQRVDADALLQLLQHAEFSVFLDHVSSGTSVRVIDRAEVANLPEWSTLPSVSVDPDQLEVGSRYRIRLVVELTLPASVIPNATFDYDNVVLRASTSRGAGQTGACQGRSALVRSGGSGNDALQGTSGKDVLLGHGGNDAVSGLGDRDCVKGHSGRDTLKGGAGRDRIVLGKGRDRSAAGPGNDTVNARDGGRDRVNCGGGNDLAKVDRKDKVRRNCERVKVRRG